MTRHEYCLVCIEKSANQNYLYTDSIRTSLVLIDWFYFTTTTTLMNRNSLKGLWYAGSNLSNLSNLSIRFGEIRIISSNLLDSIPRNGQWFHTNSYEIVTIYIRQILFQRPSLVMSVLVVL